MMTARQNQRLIDRLPPVRGRLTADAPLAPVTWFRVGGPAEVMFRPADTEDLAEFLAKRPPEVPVTVIGTMRCSETSAARTPCLRRWCIAFGPMRSK